MHRGRAPKLRQNRHFRQREQCEQCYGGRKQVCVYVCVCVGRPGWRKRQSSIQWGPWRCQQDYILTSGQWDVIENLGPWKEWSLLCMCAIWSTKFIECSEVVCFPVHHPGICPFTQKNLGHLWYLFTVLNSSHIFHLILTKVGTYPWNRIFILILQIKNSKLRVFPGDSVQFISVMSSSLPPHGLQHSRLPCPSSTPRACSNSCPLGWWCHPTISSSVVPFSSCLQSFPASQSFPVSQLLTSGGQSIGVSASASVLPMNIQDWFPLGWTGWISVQSKGLSRVFSLVAQW